MTGWSRCLQRDAYASNHDGSDKVHIWDEPRELDGVNVTYELGSETAIPLQNDLPLPIATASLNKLVERVTDDKSHGAARHTPERAPRSSPPPLTMHCRVCCWVCGWVDVCGWAGGADLNFLKTSSGWSLGTGPNLVIADAGFGADASTTTARPGVYAFIFDQKGLMAGVGLVGQKISPIK